MCFRYHISFRGLEPKASIEAKNAAAQYWRSFT